MAKGAQLAVVLGGCEEGEAWKDIANAYGRNLGIAFQVGSLTMCCLFSFFFPFVLPLLLLNCFLSH